MWSAIVVRVLFSIIVKGTCGAWLCAKHIIVGRCHESGTSRMAWGFKRVSNKQRRDILSGIAGWSWPSMCANKGTWVTVMGSCLEVMVGWLSDTA
jgi:hypothetical protein